MYHLCYYLLQQEFYFPFPVTRGHLPLQDHSMRFLLSYPGRLYEALAHNRSELCQTPAFGSQSVSLRSVPSSPKISPKAVYGEFPPSCASALLN